MEREALEYAVKLSKPEIMEIGGYTYTDKSVGVVNTPSIRTVEVHTLSSLVDLIRVELGICDSPLIVHIDGPDHITVRSGICEEDRSREIPYIAAADLPNIYYDTYIDVETAIIQLKSKFSPTPDRDSLIALIGNITEEQVQSTSDNGISQTVTGRTGINLKQAKPVPTVVSLAPYRTFLEVEQPASDFLVRLKDGPRVALFEADGGAWKIDAAKRVFEYLEEALNSLEGVIIIA
jgi:hypothetical protein